MNIKAKATVFATLVLTGMLAVLSAGSMYLVKADLTQQIGVRQLSLAQQAADDIDEKFQLRVRALNAVSKHVAQELSGVPDREQLTRILGKLPALGEMFDDIFAFDAGGSVLARIPPGPLVFGASDREYFQRTLAARSGVISEPYAAKASKEPSVMITAPVVDARGDIVAVLGGQLNLLKPNFLGQLREDRIGTTGSFALIGRDRTIVISRDRDRILTKGPPAGTTRYLDRLAAGEDGWEEDVNSRGLHAVFGFKLLDSVPWAMVAALPVAEAYAPIAAAQGRLAIGTVIVAAMLALLLWFGLVRLLDPLLGLRNAIRTMREQPATGVLLPEGKRDEIGDLARDFNALLAERREATSALRESEARFREVTENAEALIGYIDAEQIFRFNNRTYEIWMCRGRESITGHGMREVLGADYARFEPYILRALAGERVRFEGELTESGPTRAVQGVYVPRLGEDGSVLGFFSLVSDITTLKAAERKLVHAVNNDSLTGTASRALFLDRLQQAAARSRRSGALLALMYLDIDHFKGINDSRGHAAGDALLREFARRLQSSVRESDTVARLGGDEFVVLLEDLTQRADALLVADKILVAVRAPVALGEDDILVTTSIGVSFARASDLDADALVQRADKALYEAKDAGRDAFRVAG